MSLLSTDITKVKRLSLRDAKLPTIERVEETLPTEEEITYGRLVAINPIIEELVERLDLVSIITGERVRRVDIRDSIKPRTETGIKAQDVDKPKLMALAQRVIAGGTTYTKEEVIDRIKGMVNVSQERAERGFNLILQVGAIEPTLEDKYYLAGSTPF